MSVEQRVAAVPAWASEPTEECTLPQRVRDEHTAPTLMPREVPAWLSQPTGVYREIIARIREQR